VRTAPLDLFPPEMKHALHFRLREIAGYMLLGFALIAGFSLMSWTASDPASTTTGTIQTINWLGKPGARLADTLMTWFGLGSMLFVLVPLIWGVLLTFKKGLGAEKSRIAYAVLGLFLLTAAFACLPKFNGWVLTIGLGGTLGDGLVRLLTHITGGLGAVGAFLMFFMFGALAIKSLQPALSTTIPKSVKRKIPDEELFERHEGSIIFAYIKHVLTGLKPRAQPARKHVEPVYDEPSYNEPLEQYRPFIETPSIAPKLPRTISARPEDDYVEPVSVSRETPIPVEPDRYAPVSIAKDVTRKMPRFDDYILPPLDLMADAKPSDKHPSMSMEFLQENARRLENVLDDFGVRGEIINVRPGPVVTLYELEPAPGTKSSRVIGLADDIARSMSAVSARVAVIPGKNAIGIELPNLKRNNVMFREMLASRDYVNSRDKLTIALGKTIGGDPVMVDLTKMPHLLVAGTTGSGKSVAINTMILSLLYKLKPEECRLIMVDPKMLELSIYDGIPHLLTPVVTDPKKAVVALKWAVREMEERYKKMSKLGVRNIEGYNARIKEAALKGETLMRTVQTGFDRETGEATYEQEEMNYDSLPFIVVIVDEMADLMMVAGKDIEGAIQRLAQMARAAGIHLIMATQRPSVDVITGTIKANFPTRISFQVTSKIDSRTILGEQGAEQLLGRGDMLYMAGGGRIQRVHGPFVADGEVEAVVAHLKTQGTPEYLSSVTEDDGSEPEEKPAKGGAVMDKGDFSAEEPADLYERAVQIVLRDKKASTSYVQRRMQIGYNRAASLIERMEKEGIVGQANHAGKREILVEHEEEDIERTFSRQY
jgi:DNA segregation ATPase FtsK/SpoIIIE, S-DNA-T family